MDFSSLKIGRTVCACGGLMLCLLGARTSWADNEPIASVVAVRGKVEATGTDGTSRRLKLKANLFLHDTIKTNDRGRIQICFDDDTLVSLGRKTVMLLEDFEYDPSAGKGRLITRVEEGVFRVMGGAITKIAPENFKTVTPTATIGIRGSFYLGILKDEELRVIFLGGRGINVANEFGTVELRTASAYSVVPRMGMRPEFRGRVPFAELKGMLRQLATVLPGEERMNRVVPRKEQLPVLPGVDGEEGDGVRLPINTLPEGERKPLPEDVPPSLRVLRLAAWTPELEIREDLQLGGIHKMDGRHMAVLEEAAGVVGRAGDLFWMRDLAATSELGVISGKTLGLDTPDFAFQFKTYAVNDVATTSYSLFSDTEFRRVWIDGNLRTSTHERIADPWGEFAVFRASDWVVDSEGRTQYLFSDLGFAGVPWTGDVATAGTASYKGLGLAAVTTAAGISPVPGTVTCELNAACGKVFGSFSPETSAGGTMFFYGDFTGGEFRNTEIVGGGTTASYDGALTFDQFYGSFAQGLGITGLGDQLAVDDFTDTGDLDIAAGLVRTEINRTAPAGNAAWTGFAVAVPLSLEGIRVYGDAVMNTATDPTGTSFSMDLDRDAGRITGGTISLKNALVPGTGLSIDGLGVGGAYGSVYVSDDAMLARLGGADTIVTTLDTADPKPESNYLATAPSGEQTSACTSWGYWGVAYDNPDTGDAQIISAESALWIAGERISDQAMARVSPEFEGTYAGGARGYRITATESSKMVGTSAFTVNFSEASVDGTLTFPKNGVVMTIDTAILAGGNGFAGDVSSINGVPTSPANSVVSGDFFGAAVLSDGGTAPGAIAGAYAADVGATTFIGNFDADLRSGSSTGNSGTP